MRFGTGDQFRRHSQPLDVPVLQRGTHTVSLVHADRQGCVAPLSRMLARPPPFAEAIVSNNLRILSQLAFAAALLALGAPLHADESTPSDRASDKTQEGKSE